MNNFVTGKISEQDLEDHITKPTNGFYEDGFRHWTVNEDKSIFIVRLPRNRADEEDLLMRDYLMNFKGLWMEVNIAKEQNKAYKDAHWTNVILQDLSLVNWSNGTQYHYPDNLTNPVRQEFFESLKQALSSEIMFWYRSTEPTQTFENFV